MIISYFWVIIFITYSLRRPIRDFFVRLFHLKFFFFWNFFFWGFFWIFSPGSKVRKLCKYDGQRFYAIFIHFYRIQNWVLIFEKLIKNKKKKIQFFLFLKKKKKLFFKIMKQLIIFFSSIYEIMRFIISYFRIVIFIFEFIAIFFLENKNEFYQLIEKFKKKKKLKIFLAKL